MEKLNISYNRKSTEDKGRQAQSIEDQRKINKQTAKQLGFTINQEFIDEKTALEPYVREGFLEMTKLITEEKFRISFVGNWIDLLEIQLKQELLLIFSKLAKYPQSLHQTKPFIQKIMQSLQQ